MVTMSRSVSICTLCVPAASCRYPQRTTAELQQLAAATPVVGCPCLSVHHPLLATRLAFDVVIVDEAGQIGLPAVLGALLKARSFVLVGDHYQLPPLVLDKRAAEGGLSVSLFRQLCEAHPGSVVVLAQQYRMCRRVMGLANALVYGGQLVAGSRAVEEAVLELPRPQGLAQVRPDRAWHNVCVGVCLVSGYKTLHHDLALLRCKRDTQLQLDMGSSMHTAQSIVHSMACRHQSSHCTARTTTVANSCNACRCCAFLQCPAWVRGLLRSNCQLAFIDTDAVQPPAAVEDAPAPGCNGVVNAGEAALLMQLLEGLLVCGVPGSDITMVSPYKAQVGGWVGGCVFGWVFGGRGELQQRNKVDWPIKGRPAISSRRGQVMIAVGQDALCIPYRTCARGLLAQRSTCHSCTCSSLQDGTVSVGLVALLATTL
jgi:hypothetical protein